MTSRSRLSLLILSLCLTACSAGSPQTGSAPSLAPSSHGSSGDASPSSSGTSDQPSTGIPAPSSTTPTPAGSVDASPSAASSQLTRTNVVEINPFDASGSPKQGALPVPDDQGMVLDCREPQASMFATTAGTLSCGPTAAAAFACWPVVTGQMSGRAIACMSSPWSKMYTHKAKLGWIPTAAQDDMVPLAAVLEDGSKWQVLSHATTSRRDPGLAGFYTCVEGCAKGEEDLLWTTDLSLGKTFTMVPKGVWTARRGTPTQKPRTVKVAEVYFIASTQPRRVVPPRPADAKLTVFKPGLKVSTRAQLASLPVSADFRAFLAKQLSERPGMVITLERYRSDGWASVNTVDRSEGDVDRIHATWGGSWGEAFAAPYLDGLPDCSAVEAAMVPAEVFAGQCIKPGNKTVDYTGPR